MVCGIIACPYCLSALMTTLDQKSLTHEEELFALGVIEYSGNVGLAYINAYGPDVLYAQARGRALLNEPHILARVNQLQAAQQDTELLNMSAHLIELASIRDLAKKLHNPKVALEAERSRGEVVGLYNKAIADPRDSVAMKAEAVRAAVRAAMSVVDSAQ